MKKIFDIELINEIKKELIKDKKFRDELSIVLVNEFVEANNMNVSEKDINKRTKEIFKTLIDMKLKSVNKETLNWDS